jgi:perosamine synthetase
MKDERAKIAQKYNKAFKNSSIELPFIKEDRDTSWHLYVIKVNNRDELYNKLKEEGIGASVHFIPVHKHPYYKDN